MSGQCRCGELKMEPGARVDQAKQAAPVAERQATVQPRTTNLDQIEPYDSVGASQDKRQATGASSSGHSEPSAGSLGTDVYWDSGPKEEDEFEEEDAITVKYLPLGGYNAAAAEAEAATKAEAEAEAEAETEASTAEEDENNENEDTTMPTTLGAAPQALPSSATSSLESQVRIVEHIRKNYTLFESNRKIYEYSPSRHCAQHNNKGHLQSLLVSSKGPQSRARIQPEPASQAARDLHDQYTQYRESDIVHLISGHKPPAEQREKPVQAYSIPVEPPIRGSRRGSGGSRTPAQANGSKSRTLEARLHTSKRKRESASSSSSGVKLSVHALNELLKRPLELVAFARDRNKAEAASQQSGPEEAQYKVPVRQLHCCSQDIYLQPVPDRTVNIATRSIGDIVSAYNLARLNRSGSNRAGEQAATSGPRNKLSQLFARHSSSFRRSQKLRESISSLAGLRGAQKRAPPGYYNLVGKDLDHSTSVLVRNIGARVRMPSGKSDKATVVDNKDGTVKISYEPKEVGQHEITIRYNDENVEDSPIVFYVDAVGAAKKKITAYGSGLSRGLAGEPCRFTLNTGGLGSAKLNVSVEGPSKTQVSLNDNKDGTIAVSYTTQSSGEYRIKISFDGKQVVGSPFSAQIGDEGRQRSQLTVGRGSEHTLDLKISEEDLKSLNGVIVTPCGLEEPCALKLLAGSGGQLAIVFTPREQGEHLVNVKRRGNHISGSPFKFEVLSRDIGDAKQVRVTGKNLKEGKTNADNEILISTKEAGYGGLSVAFEGPGRSELTSKEQADGAIKLCYRTQEPGQYSLSVKYADHAVAGSPFAVKVSGPGTNPQKESLRRYRKLAQTADANTECHFTFKLPGTSAYDLSAKIHSPQGNSEDASIKDKGDYIYQVSFVPKEVGLYSLSIRNKDIHTPGSPFPFTVGPLLDGGPHRVRCGGPGLLRGTCGRLNEFDVFTREAGAGDLCVLVEGPAKPELSFGDRKDGSCHVGYKVAEPGEYRISVLFNHQEVPDSPFRAYIMPLTGDVAKIELGPLPPENMIQLNKPCNMTVIMNGAKGNINGKVMLPSGKMEDCFASPIDAENWGVRFIPRELGIHQVHIKFNKESSHIPQSPIFIRVGHDKADPASVLAHGNGLRGAIVNHATDFTVETCNAGHALLDVNIEGPSKVSMSCAEIDEGYKVEYTPLAPGDYIISIKYNGCHIGSSPFRVRAIKQPGSRTVADIGSREVSSISVATTDREAKQKVENMPKFKSDASRVYCKGMGLKKAFAGKPNTLTVNCSEAGFNMIYASFLGPTRNTIHECSIKHMGGSIYEVKYTCKDRGDAILVVKYGDEQIPGSPFRLECV